MLNKKFKKAVASVTMFATVVALSGVSMLAPIAASAATTIVDGDLISSNATNSDGTPTYASLDTYIVKIVGEKKFKRLVLNPTIFNSYQHLKWENIKEVDQSVVDSYTESFLARVDGDDKVYALTPDDDNGNKSWINLSAADFLGLSESDPDSIYTINSVDGTTYDRLEDITTVAELEAFYEDGTLPEEEEGDGALKVSLSADTAEAANIPIGVGVEFFKFNLSATGNDDVRVDSVTLTAGGFKDGENIVDIAIYDEDGIRLNSTLKSITGDDTANINLGGFIVEEGETETLTVKAQITGSGNEGIYSLSIDLEDDINSDASSISGSFPIEGNEMNAVFASNLATLTFDDGTSPSGVDLGDKGAVLAKVDVAATIADATINRISFKRSAVGSGHESAADDDFENLALYVGSTKVAEADEITNKYVTFIIDDGIDIDKGDTAKLSLRADVIGGAGKYIMFLIDKVVDVEAMGSKYPAIVAFAAGYNGSEVAIDAGAVALEKVNADPLKVKTNTDDVVLGTIKVTANSGEDVVIEDFRINITTVGDNTTATEEFENLTNVEIYDATDKVTYGLDYVSGAATKIYGDDAINIEMESGETHEFVIRGDIDDLTGNAADGNTYTVSLVAADDITIKTVEDEEEIEDITPSSVTLKKVTVEASGIDFALKTLSNKTAVAGSEGVEAIRFSVEADVSDITINELRFVGTPATAVLTKSVVSGFALYNTDRATVIEAVGANGISGEEITLSDLNIEVKAGEVETFYLTVDVASGISTGDIKLALSGYDAEDEDDNVYDASLDADTDGDIDAIGDFTSARTITIVGTGSLTVSIDNTDSKVKKDIYAVAGTPTSELAALKLKASNEDINIDEIVVTATKVGGAADVALADTFSSLVLVNEADYVVDTAKLSSSTATFEDVNYVVEVGEETLYLKGTLNKIGEDEPGILDADMTFAFTVDATGDASGDELVGTPTGNTAGTTADAGELLYESNDTATTTGSSKKFGVLASRISSVELVNTDGSNNVETGLINGAQNVAIIKVTADKSANTNSDGEAVKTTLSKIRINLTTTEIIDTDAPATDGVVRIKNTDGDWVTGTYAAGVATFTVSGSDFEIAPSSTEYFVVNVSFSSDNTFGSGENDDTLRASLGYLDGTVSSDANFDWVDSDESGTDTKGALRLGKSSIDGVYIKG